MTEQVADGFERSDASGRRAWKWCRNRHAAKVSSCEVEREEPPRSSENAAATSHFCGLTISQLMWSSTSIDEMGYLNPKHEQRRERVRDGLLSATTVQYGAA